MSIDGITATATAYVAELTGSDPVLGPFQTSSGSLGAGFNQDAEGIGLYATPATTSAPISGSEACCGLVRGGINSHEYLSGDTTVETMNFVVFEFSAPVSFTAITLVGVTSHNRGSWVASGMQAPNLTGSIQEALTGFSVVNLLDEEGSAGPRTFDLDPVTDYRYMIVGASPTEPLGDIEAVEITGNFRIQSFDSSPGPAVPAMSLLGLGFLVSCIMALSLGYASPGMGRVAAPGA